MKKFLIFLAVVFALYSIHKYMDERGFRKESQGFVIEALTAIAKNWNLEDFKAYAAPKFAMNKNATGVFANYRTLGKLTRDPDCELKDFTSYKYQGTDAIYKALTYRCEAQFENAPATIQLIIYRFQDKSAWKIEYFTLTSPYFTPAPKAAPASAPKPKP